MALDRPPVFVPPDGSPVKPLLFAIAVHAALFAMLALGVAWKTSDPAPVEVELWSAVPQVAERAEPTPPPPNPVPVPVPAPEPVVKAPPPVVDPTPPVPDPDIALQKARDEAKKKAEADRLQELEKLKQKAEADRKALEDAKKQQQIRAAEQAKLDDAKKLEEQKKNADQKKLDDAKKRADDAKEQAKRDADFKKQVAALAAAAGTATGSTSGTAAATSGPRSGSAAYSGRVGQIIRGNTTFPDDQPGNPVVEFDVSLDPAGGILNLVKTKASGTPGFDDAVERAIRKSQPFPPDGIRPPSSLHIVHKLKE
ncbi:hypothetical protein BH10PSE17_BH10PSE17_31460 [soil metagenome]